MTISKCCSESIRSVQTFLIYCLGDISIRSPPMWSSFYHQEPQKAAQKCREAVAAARESCTKRALFKELTICGSNNAVL